MLPLKIAILWHQHQPVYNHINNGVEEFILPWTRLHAVKDYLDLPLLLHKFPKIKQTFNLVPSLLVQLNEYTSGKVTDKVFRLSKIRAEHLTFDEKKEILSSFFICNLDNLILPHSRFRELYYKNFENKNAVNEFTNQDYLDLQVWYNLTWVGEISRKNPLIKRLLDKGSNYTELEKNLLLDCHLELMSEILKQYKLLYNLGQIDISVSPFYHPILPLLIDTNTALESMPNLDLEKDLFQYSDDAEKQIDMSIEYLKEIFPDYNLGSLGFWPSEGSISNEVLNIFAEKNVKWAASDETIYYNSINKHDKLDKYFPKVYNYNNSNIDNKNENVVLFFRDHILSDKIGFLYSNWNPEDAVTDFTSYLNNIRNEIIHNKGEETLKQAVVTIILDGENCWEFYKNNGIEFLEKLYSYLENDENLNTVTFSEIVNTVKNDGYNLNNKYELLSNIRAGSWINGNFKIWIGHKEDQIAWKYLSEARRVFDGVKNNLSLEVKNQAYKYLLIAEGSDWYWWFGDEHSAPNMEDFDVLFRHYLVKFYTLVATEVKIDIPVNLNNYIMQKSEKQVFAQPTAPITPIIDGLISAEDHWFKAGFYNTKAEMQAMHQFGEILNKFIFGSDDRFVYFRLDTEQRLADDEEVIISVNYPVRFDLKFHKYGYMLYPEEPMHITSIKYAVDQVIEVAIDKTIFKRDETLRIDLCIITKSDDGEIRYPRNGTIRLEV